MPAERLGEELGGGGRAWRIRGTGRKGRKGLRTK